MLQHSVQASRVQQIVKGDDTTQTHQIMEDVSYDAELSRAPVMVATGDVVRFFYPLEDPTQTDLTGYVGVAVGTYPTSQFTVATPGVIIDPAAVAPNRGTSTFQSGLARTVRAEITRIKASILGNTTISTPTISNVSSFTDVTIGASVVGAGVPVGAIIIAINSVAATITLSANATATATGVTLTIGIKETHYAIDEVDIYERGFESSLIDTSGGVNPPQPNLNLT